MWKRKLRDTLDYHSGMIDVFDHKLTILDLVAEDATKAQNVAYETQ